MTFTCKLCKFKCCTIEKYNSHQYLHRNWTKAIFYCMHQKCLLEFKKYNQFKLHIYKIHSKCERIPVDSRPTNNFFVQLDHVIL